MADNDRALPITGTPRSMRPRSSANAEVNAQQRDQFLRDVGQGYPAPEVKDLPLRGYAKGGKVSKDWRKGKTISSNEC